MAELGRKEAEQLIKEILTEYARKIRSAKKREYAEDIQQQLFNPKIDAFYKLAKSEDMDFYIFNRLNDEGIRQLLVGCRRLAKCYELDSYGKIKDFTYEPESPKCRIASDSGGKYTAGGSYTFTLEGKAELGNKWYEPYRVVWHFYRENPGTGKYEETASKMDEARALADFDTGDRSFLVSEKGRYKVTATIFNQAITTGIRPDIVEVCELYFEAEERNIAALSCSDKIRIAMEYSNVIDEIREEIGDINILVTQMVIVSSFLIGLALTGYGAAAEALGFVLLAAGAAMSGTQLLAGVIELVKFFTTVDDAKTEDDLKVCGKIFGDAVAKIGVDGLFFFLSMFGLKKASAKLTTRTVIDNGLNSKKWAGKQIEEKELDVEFKKNIFKYKHNPSENPKVLQDAIVDENAVYGYSPNPKPTSRISGFANGDLYDWSNPDKVKVYRERRIQYHIENDNIDRLIIEMKKNNKSIEEIARAANARRNQNRLYDYIKRNDYEGLEKVKQSNLKTYGNELGITAEDALRKYGSWEKVIEKTKSANPGMDACCGLYDVYYDLYNIK